MFDELTKWMAECVKALKMYCYFSVHVTAVIDSNHISKIVFPD